MHRSLFVPLLATVLGACSRRPIHDGQQVGPLIQIKDVFTSCFLLEFEPGRFALFDACNQGSGASITRTMERLGHDDSDIRWVFLTHGHTDHLGGINALDSARVYAPWAEKDAIEAEGVDVKRTVVDGSTVSLGRYSIRAFSVPGHTPGSTVYEVGRVLVMGDVVIAQRDGSLEPPPDRTSDDPGQNLRSVRALADQLRGGDVEVDWIAPAHSGPVHGLPALLDF